MGTVARWGKHKFMITRKKVNPMYSFSTSYGIKEDSNTDTSGKKKTNTRGRAPEEPSFSVDYIAAVGCKPRNEFTAWRGRVGKKNYLYIGGTKYGKNPFELKSADISDVILDNKGRTAKATVTLSFLEIIQKKKSKKSSKSGAKNAKPSKTEAKIKRRNYVDGGVKRK